MPYVHSLVRSAAGDARNGWLAPVELGEAAPQYVSFAVPVDDAGQVFPSYQCETVTAHDRAKSITTYELILVGRDSFLLRVEGQDFLFQDFWFIVKPVPKSARRLPYVGRLEHPDFQLLFTEIEAEDPAKLDRLCDEHRTFVIGCDPFTHYQGIQQLAPGKPGPRRRRAQGTRARPSSG